MLQRVIHLTLVVVVSLALATPASAGMARGGGFQTGFGGGGHGSESRGGFHHHRVQRTGCCFGPVAVGRAFLGLGIAEPTYVSTLAMDAGVLDAPAAAEQPTVIVAPPIFCYFGGCYHLQGNGISVPYQWAWVAAGPGQPPAPPPLPAGVR